MKKISKLLILFFVSIFLCLGCVKKTDDSINKETAKEANYESHEEITSPGDEAKHSDEEDSGDEDFVLDEDTTTEEENFENVASEIEISELEPIGEAHPVTDAETIWQRVKFTVKNKGQNTLSFNIFPYATKKIDEYGDIIDLDQPVLLEISQEKGCFDYGSEVLPRRIYDKFDIFFQGPNVQYPRYEDTFVTYLEPNEERTYCVNLSFLKENSTDPSVYTDFYIDAGNFIYTEEDAENALYPHVSKEGDFSQELIDWEDANMFQLEGKYKIKNNTDRYIKKVFFVGEAIASTSLYDEFFDWSTYAFEALKPGDEKEMDILIDATAAKERKAPQLEDISIYIVDPEK